MKRSKIIRNRDKKTNFDTDIYYISIGSNPRRWFDIKDIHDIVVNGNMKNPITNEKISDFDIQKIKIHMNTILKNDTVSKTYDILPIEERLEDIDTKIETINTNLEDYYSEIIKMRNTVDNINK